MRQLGRVGTKGRGQEVSKFDLVKKTADRSGLIRRLSIVLGVFLHFKPKV